MVKTTVYLSENLKRRVERAASSSNVSEAQFIRASLEEAVGASGTPPRGGIIEGTVASPIDWNSNGHLSGFGER